MEKIVYYANKEDEYKHIHGSVISSGKFSLNNFYDTIVNKEIVRLK